MNQDYQTLLADIKATIRAGRAKAIRQLSRSVIESYWDIGRRILESQQQHGWGKGIVEQLSRDLQREFPGTEGFSARNLWDMRRFYETYGSFPNLRQRVAEIPRSRVCAANQCQANRCGGVPVASRIARKSGRATAQPGRVQRKTWR